MKKRSLFVATAMLLVAVIVATSATYAWFTSQSTSKATITMSVAKGQSLEIAAKSNDPSYKFALENSDFTDITASSLWGDFTYESNKFQTKNSTTDTDGKVTINGAKDSTPVSVTIMFRSTVAGSVQISNKFSFVDPDNNTAFNALIGYARVTVEDRTPDTHTFAHLASSAGKYEKNDTEASKLNVSYDTVTSTEITMEKVGDYYQGEATFYFWIEGTAANNTHISGLTDQLVSALSFSQATV